MSISQEKALSGSDTNCKVPTSSFREKKLQEKAAVLYIVYSFFWNCQEYRGPPPPMSYAAQSLKAAESLPKFIQIKIIKRRPKFQVTFGGLYSHVLVSISSGPV